MHHGPVLDDSEQKLNKWSNKELKTLNTKDNLVRFVRSSVTEKVDAWVESRFLIKMVLVDKIDRKKPLGLSKNDDLMW